MQYLSQHLSLSGNVLTLTVKASGNIPHRLRQLHINRTNGRMEHIDGTLMNELMATLMEHTNLMNGRMELVIPMSGHMVDMEHIVLMNLLNSNMKSWRGHVLKIC